MAYAGNQVNTNAALSNKLQASQAQANAHLAYGQTIGQGLQNITNSPIQAYMAAKQLENQTKDVDSAARLRKSQAKHTDATTKQVKIDNETRGKQNEANIAQTQAQTGLTKANAWNVNLNSQIIQPQALVSQNMSNFFQSKAGKAQLATAMKGISGDMIRGVALGTKDANYQGINNTNQPAQDKSSQLSISINPQKHFLGN